MVFWYKYNAYGILDLIWMINHRNKQNYRFRTWKYRDRCHLKGGVRQGCFLSLILNNLIQYIHFHSLYITSHYYAKFKENPCVGTDARPPLKVYRACFTEVVRSTYIKRKKNHFLKHLIAKAYKRDFEYDFFVKRNVRPYISKSTSRNDNNKNNWIFRSIL